MGAHRHDHGDHDHSHQGHGRNGGLRERQSERRGLLLALGTTSVILVAEAIGGWLSNSLALLADAGHMLNDALALALAYVALKLATRPATSSKTYGWYRLEILAALVNGVGLVLISGFIVWEAYERLAAPPEIELGLMMVIAIIGLVANGFGLFFLSGHGHSLNLKGAYLHVLGDLLSSVGVVVGGAVMLLTGMYWVDPLLSLLISLIIVVGAWRLLRESVDVLLEATPAGIELENVGEAICTIDGVEGVHDLHVWSLTSGVYAMSCHAEVREDRLADIESVLDAVQIVLRERFGIGHTTIQVEPEHYKRRALVRWHVSGRQNAG